LFAQELIPRRERFVTAMTITDGDRLGAGGVKDHEILGTGMRTGTGSTRVTELVAMTEILKRVLHEKIAIPALLKVCHKFTSGDWTRREEG
jgi:hypothetical protein